MSAQRKQQSAAANTTQNSPSLPNMAEMLRIAQVPAGEYEKKEDKDDKMSLFWRVFGGTVLSIVAMLVVTAYQSIAGSMSELRSGQSRLIEAQADFAKKEELNSKLTSLWVAQKQTATEVPTLQTRAMQLENQVKSLEQDRKELQQLVQRLGERVLLLEARAKPASTTTRPATPRVPAMEASDD